MVKIHLIKGVTVLMEMEERRVLKWNEPFNQYMFEGSMLLWLSFHTYNEVHKYSYMIFEVYIFCCNTENIHGFGKLGIVIYPQKPLPSIKQTFLHNQICLEQDCYC